MKLRRLDTFPDLQDGQCRTMQARDGRQIRVALWPANQPSPKGTICLLQGRAEFIEKYYEVISELRSRGFAIATLDWRGQGASDHLLSDPLIGHVDSFADYGRDLSQFLQEHVLPDCPPPFFALAHSMGALILLNNLPRMRTMIERAILCAPLIELAEEQRRTFGIPLRQSTIRRFTRVMKWIGRGKKYVLGAERNPLSRSGFNDNPLTSDGPRYDRNRQFFIDFPELAIAGPTNSWVLESCKAMKMLQNSDFRADIHIPTLMITASTDTIVSTDAAEYFAKSLRAGHAVSIAGSRHEILMERDGLRAQFWAAFDSFIPGSG